MCYLEMSMILLDFEKKHWYFKMKVVEQWFQKYVSSLNEIEGSQSHEEVQEAPKI